MPAMKGQIDTVEDDFWTERLPFFTAQFPTYYRKPQQVHGRVHTSDERYFDGSRPEIIPLTQRSGTRTYILMHPYVLEPKLTFTVGLYNKPKHYADQESPIGEVIGSPHMRAFERYRLAMHKRGTTPPIKRLSSGSVSLMSRFRKHPLPTDANMQKLWQAFERYLLTEISAGLDPGNPF